MCSCRCIFRVDTSRAIQQHTPEVAAWIVDSLSGHAVGSRRGTDSGPMSAQPPFYGSAASLLGVRPHRRRWWNRLVRSRANLGRILPTSTLHLDRHFCRKPARTLGGRSPCCLQAQKSASRAPGSVYSSCTGYACPCSLRLAHAVVFRMPLLHAPRRARRPPPVPCPGSWPRAPPLERAVGRGCQEDGAHIVRIVRLANVNLVRSPRRTQDRGCC